MNNPNATDLAAGERNGEVRLNGKLQLAAGMTTVNHIWQVKNNVTDARVRQGEPWR
jgi:hypothetical protein